MIVNRIVSLISLSDLPLLVYRNTTDFCILILYPATLPNSLMICSTSLVASFGFSTYNILSFASSDNCTSFPILIPCFPFSSLIAVARITKTMLNKSGKSGNSCAVLDLRGNVFSFSLLSRMLAVDL